MNTAQADPFFRAHEGESPEDIDARWLREVYVVLADCLVASKGDIVWPDIDSEHPYDFVPFTRIDNLAVNLPTKAEFLQQIGAAKFEDVSPEAEDRFWNQYPFQFAEQAESLKLIWE